MCLFVFWSITIFKRSVKRRERTFGWVYGGWWWWWKDNFAFSLCKGILKHSYFRLCCLTVGGKISFLPGQDGEVVRGRGGVVRVAGLVLLQTYICHAAQLSDDWINLSEFPVSEKCEEGEEEEEEGGGGQHGQQGEAAARPWLHLGRPVHQSHPAPATLHQANCIFSHKVFTKSILFNHSGRGLFVLEVTHQQNDLVQVCTGAEIEVKEKLEFNLKPLILN